MAMATVLILPREIRHEIYMHLLHGSKITVPHSIGWTFALARVCRQLYHKVTPCFYGMHTFRLCRDPIPWDRLSDWPRQQKFLETCLSMMCTVHINLYVGKMSSKDNIDACRGQLQWIINNLIRTGGSKGPLLLKELCIRIYKNCFCDEGIRARCS